MTVSFFLACNSGDVRLRGGQTASTGRVELCIGGEWGTIASSGWNALSAQIVCDNIFGRIVTGKQN